MNKDKSFAKEYKDAKIVSLLLTICGPIFIIIGTASEWINILNPLILTFGTVLFIYGASYFFLYWKCANYIKNNQSLPTWIRIFAAILLIFYLSLYQLDNETKKHRLYLLLKEIRFYVLIWIIICLLIALLEFQLIQENNFLWFGISLATITGILIIDLILTIYIWKYNGNNSKLLKLLSIITLNYRNYQLYKEIIKLNTNEKSN